MKAIMATLMIAMAVCFTGCSGGGDTSTDDAGTTEQPERRQD